jgi:hypothetical protein
MDKAIGVVTLAFGVTALAIVLSKRTNTAKVLDSLFSGIAKLQAGATAPIK